MRIAIIYDSLSGNTKKIAEAIKEKINNKDLIYFGEISENINADLYIIGSWTDKGSCSEKISKFLQNLQNKNIAYFSTVGFGGSQKYYDSIFENVKKHIDVSNTIFTPFFCQGKMPIQVRQKYEKNLIQNPDDEMLKIAIKNFDTALSHPDKNDFDCAKKWISGIIK